MPRPKAHSLLIVDDEKAIVDSLHGLFRREYNVFTATSADEGMGVLTRERIDVVLSDQRMPGTSGSEFLTTVRDRFPDTIRILFTGYADIEAVIQAVNFGQIYGYIAKPWKPDELELFVRQAIRHLEVSMENRRLTAELMEINAKLEQKVLERTRALENLEQYKECIIQSLQSGLLVCDALGCVETMNQTAGRIMGMAPDEVKGRLLDSIPKLAHFRDAVTRTLAGGKLEYQELAIQISPGETQYIGYGTSVLVTPGGEKSGVIIIFRDTTEKRKFEEQLIQSEKLAAIGELAGGVAHEINNPLGVILGFTQLLLKQDWTDPGVKKKLRHIETQTFRCKNIVTNLLKFARKSKTDEALVNVGQIMQETLDILHRQLEVENVTIIRDIGPEPALVRANENEMQQVFFNLVVNAKDAMERGGTLTVRVTVEGGRARVSVADTGHGIPSEVLEKIWNPFFTTKPPGKGTGLGLSITRRLVEKVHGQIEVESTPTQGTRFNLSFPQARLTGDSDLDGQPPAPVVRPLKGLKILVVDDEEDILRLCGELLRSSNQVDLLPDSRGVLEILKKKSYDLMLLDVMMPGLNGLELLTAIRERYPQTLTPAVVITGGPAEEVYARRNERGILDGLFRPFTVAELEAALMEAWEPSFEPRDSLCPGSRDVPNKPLK
ncbi:MAG: response regulator [Candidatus Riflebacteria bacterium]|nr:response regulator [Candidatus Riflebacteria bacterium]